MRKNLPAKLTSQLFQAHFVMMFSNVAGWKVLTEEEVEILTSRWSSKALLRALGVAGLKALSQAQEKEMVQYRAKPVRESAATMMVSEETEVFTEWRKRTDDTLRKEVQDFMRDFSHPV